MSYKSYYEETIKNLRNERNELYRNENNFSSQEFAKMRQDFYDKFEKITQSREFKIAKNQKIKYKQEKKLYDILCIECEKKKQELNGVNISEIGDESDPELQTLKQQKNRICNAYDKIERYHKILVQELKNTEDLLSEKEQNLKKVESQQADIEKKKNSMSKKIESLQKYKEDLGKYNQEIANNEKKFPNLEKNKAEALQKVRDLNSDIRQKRLSVIAKTLKLPEAKIEIIYADDYSKLDNEKLHDMAEILGVDFGDLKTNADIINTEKDLGKDNLFRSLYGYSVGFDYDVLEKNEESQAKVSKLCNDFDESIKENSINKFFDLRQDYLDCCKELTKLRNTQEDLSKKIKQIENNVKNMCKDYTGDTIEMIDKYIQDNEGDPEESFQCRIRAEELKREIENLKGKIIKQQINLKEHGTTISQIDKKKSEILKDYNIRRDEEKAKKEESLNKKKQYLESEYIKAKKDFEEKGITYSKQKELYESDINITSKDLIRFIQGDIDRTEDELSFYKQYFDSLESWWELGYVAPITIEDLKRRLGLDASSSFLELMDKIFGKKESADTQRQSIQQPVTQKRRRVRIGCKNEPVKNKLSKNDALEKINSIIFKNDYRYLEDEDVKIFINYIREQEGNRADTVKYLDTKLWKRILRFYLRTTQETSFEGESEKKNFEKMQQNILGANCPGFFEKISKLSQSKLDTLYDMIKNAKYDYTSPLFSSETLLDLISSYDKLSGDKKSLIYLLSCNIFSTNNRYGKNELKLIIEKMSVFNCIYNGPTPAEVFDITRIEQKKRILSGLGFRFIDPDFQKDFDLTAFDYTK